VQPEPQWQTSQAHRVIGIPPQAASGIIAQTAVALITRLIERILDFPIMRMRHLKDIAGFDS
jgi:hypothetical protein